MEKIKKGHIDYVLLFTVIALLIIGVIMVFSSSYYYALNKFSDKYYFIKKEIFMVIIGIIGMISASYFDYRYYRKLTPIISFFALTLMIATLLFGVEINNAKRWLDIGSQRFMPSEIMKIAAIMMFSYWLSSKRYKIKGFISLFKPYLLYMLVVSLLIILQPNMSTTVLIMVVLFSLLFIGKMKYRHVLLFITGGIGVGGLLAYLEPYRLRRVVTFIDPFKDPTGDGWQVVNSLYALGSGGVWGSGIGKGLQNKLYIPEPQNDFIFATLGEETGLIGSMILISLFYIFFLRGVNISRKAPDDFGKYLSMGIILLITFQMLINVGVATSSIPVTGIPLPFISYGGTSLAIMLFSVGILLNISKKGNENENSL
jgi:cell division protein FtsW